jgi:hypothetical protein
MRNDARSGRLPADGASSVAHWVAHARTGWSRQHLEQPAEWVHAQLLAALRQVLHEALGARAPRDPGDWLHTVVHRWRYAVPAAAADAPSPPCWWDGAAGLGVCGDFFGRAPDAAAEGAWRSARALVQALLAERELRATHARRDAHVAAPARPSEQAPIGAPAT